MPRRARIDLPNIVQHVIGRGIEGREIFRDSKDRQEFLRRLAEVVSEGKAQLFAWCLMPNHYHLLLRPREMKLAVMMRRLMTGYAVWYNLRYARKGHLFQNRYKSIVVEEDSYFLELVRYIHLNPVRAGVVGRLSELDRFPYSGHVIIMGRQEYGCQDVDGVLAWFGSRRGKARLGYASFIEEGFNQGKREDLQGGGLIRSSGGRQKWEEEKGSKEGLGDARILGSGEFVEGILGRVQTPCAARVKRSYEEILGEVSNQFGISWEQILGRSRDRRISRARQVFFLRAYGEAGESLTFLGRLCGITHSSVRAAINRAVKKGEEEK